MQPTFPYTAMITTGCMHIIFGAVILVLSCIGLGHVTTLRHEFDAYPIEDRDKQRLILILFACILATSFWVLIVGTLGVLTGVKHRYLHRTKGFKVAYMVTSILSAVIFMPFGTSVSIINAVIFNGYSYGIISSLFCFAGFILSIVSASICCCCSGFSTSAVFVHRENYPPDANLEICHHETYQPAPCPNNFQFAIQSPEGGIGNPGYQPNYVSPTAEAF